MVKKKKMQFRDNPEDRKFNNGSFGSILKRRYHRLIEQGRGAPKAIPFHQKIGESRVQHYADVESSPEKEESIILFHDSDSESDCKMHDSDKKFITGSDQQFEDILKLLKIEVLKDQDLNFGSNPSFNTKAEPYRHKKTESWPFRKGKSFDHQKRDCFLDAQETTFSSLHPPYKSDVNGWNDLIVKPINSFKQRIKRALHKKGSRTEFDLRSITKGPPEVDFNVPLGSNDSSAEETFLTKSGLLESLEKYARLLGSVDSKLQQSRSLKLRNDEDRGVWISRGAELRRKAASFSDIESSGLFLNYKEVSNGDKEETNRVVLDEAVKSQDSCSNDEEEEAELRTPLCEANGESPKLHHDGESSNFQTKGPEQEREDLQSLLQSYYKLDKTVEANFNFVRDLLELSGFLRDGYTGTLFSTKDSVSFECSDQRLMFDLVNDCLAEIYGTRFNCFDHRTRPQLKGEHVLEDVWGRVSWYMKLSSERSVSYTEIVAGDVTEEVRSWVKMGGNTEGMVLEVDDMVFDDLLDEALCCFEGAFDD